MSDFETPEVVKSAYEDDAADRDGSGSMEWEELLREALLEVA